MRAPPLSMDGKRPEGGDLLAMWRAPTSRASVGSGAAGRADHPRRATPAHLA